MAAVVCAPASAQAAAFVPGGLLEGAARHPNYMSGYTYRAIVGGGVLDLSTEFLHKPFSFDDLARRVRSILDTAA